ncbi:FAD-dependent oxidoreductase [Novosphingobium sp. YJ-S2-02]|uniref:FAD-dependent oxidoreductase n=1 Tax=Novosphingobium aureum TaxID=2792964 RepID=A0A931MJF5_9SPHN|nr:FAD-dependent oxidoreductase [Novosphingobium aureum]MBH0111369.1 FAD-dependent oxidoreductase [Novosphingobium aureum]
MTQTPDFGAGIAASSLGRGEMQTGTFDGADILLIRAEDGTLRAVSATCTHLGAPLETGALIEGEIRCPWHHARFSLEDGQAVGGPATESLGCYEVEESDGTIRVTGRRHVSAPRPALEVATPVVIVGSGAAGYALADMLARDGHGADTILVSADEEAPYDRTFLSKQYLAGDAERSEVMLPATGQGLGDPVDIRTGAKVTAIDTKAGTLRFEDGSSLDYGTLVLATGAEPVAPDFLGRDDPRVHTLRTLADADALLAQAHEGKRATVLGASFIGLEVAASLVQRGLKVDVVAQGEVPLAPVLGERAGRHIQSLHEAHGVTFHMGRSLTSFEDEAVWLDDGTRLPADLLVLGTGVRPRLELARDAGLALAEDDDGIAVDGNLRTSAPAIYAIGDIASYPDPRLERPLRIEHWVHAQRQGGYLARLFTGASDERFGDTPFFWTGYYGTQLRYVGHASPDDARLEGDLDEGTFALFYREEGKDRAMLSSGRDKEALATEAKWDTASHA